MPARLPMLTPEQCDLVIDRLQAHRSRWTQRLRGLPFYTLGAASYLDAESGRTAYRERARALNPLLEREFGWLYERLRSELSRCLAAEVSHEPRAALPGFHIFLSHRAFRASLGRIHFDLQFMHIDWLDADRMDFLHPVSYTLAIRLPRSGAGLLTWDITKAEYDAMAPDERSSIARDRTSNFLPYTEGELICHSGMLLHQIAPARGDPDADDMRITLQGHALHGPEGFHLYW